MDIFSNEPNQADQLDNQNSNQAANQDKVDIWIEKLTSITRPDGAPKYESVEQALDALKASQDHIARLEQEAVSLKETAIKVSTLEETLKRLGGNNMNSNENPVPKTQDNGGQNEEAAAELVKKILNQTLSERDQVTEAVNNVKAVQDQLVKRYGMEKTREIVASKAKELGTTPEQLKNLSASNPKLVLELFGGPQGSSSPNTGSLNLGSRPNPRVEIERPVKSLLSGPSATDRNRIDYLKKLQEKVYRENGIT